MHRLEETMIEIFGSRFLVPPDPPPRGGEPPSPDAKGTPYSRPQSRRYGTPVPPTVSRRIGAMEPPIKNKTPIKYKNHE